MHVHNSSDLSQSFWLMALLHWCICRVFNSKRLIAFILLCFEFHGDEFSFTLGPFYIALARQCRLLVSGSLLLKPISKLLCTARAVQKGLCVKAPPPVELSCKFCYGLSMTRKRKWCRLCSSLLFLFSSPILLARILVSLCDGPTGPRPQVEPRLFRHESLSWKTRLCSWKLTNSYLLSGFITERDTQTKSKIYASGLQLTFTLSTVRKNRSPRTDLPVLHMAWEQWAVKLSLWFEFILAGAPCSYRFKSKPDLVRYDCNRSFCSGVSWFLALAASLVCQWLKVTHVEM